MAETTGKIILCYDVNDKQTQVKEAMEMLGYFDWWNKNSTNTRYYLPDTTIWHPSTTVSEAIKDLRKVCADLEVTLEKAFSALTNDEVAGYKV